MALVGLKCVHPLNPRNRRTADRLGVVMTTSSLPPKHVDYAAEPEALWHSGTYADVVEELFREYEDSLPLCAILAVVNGCRHDLAGSPLGAMPELLERLARYRIDNLLHSSTESAAPHREP